jgi:hypothetical protein
MMAIFLTFVLHIYEAYTVHKNIIVYFYNYRIYYAYVHINSMFFITELSLEY